MHSLQFSHSVVSDSLWPHGLQHARLPRPSPTPGTYSNSCLASWWCHPTTSSSVIPFSSCLQSFPASGSFPMSQLFTSGGQRIGASASASVLAMSIRRHSMGLRVCACVQWLRCVQLFTTPWTIALQTPVSMGSPWQECWCGLPFPPPGIFLTQGLNAHLLHQQANSFPLSHLGSYIA